MDARTAIGSLALSAATLVGIALHEGYKPDAYTPVAGDKLTIGFGTTEGVKAGDKITPERALQRLMGDADKAQKAVKQCAPVPMYQYEFDAFVSLTYNIGVGNFCSSTLAKKLNAGDYSGACKEILRWDKFKGQQLPGLANRRAAEYRKCLGS